MTGDAYKRAPRRRAALRALVMDTYPWVCVICREPITSSREFTVEHLRPRSRGGDPFDLDNCAPAHQRCNASRGNRPLLAAIERARARPAPSRDW